MSKAEVFSAYILPALIAVLTALAGYIGTQIKRLYEKYVNDKVKQDVVRTCVKAAEQLYRDLSGPEKLEKAKEGIVEMLNEKGIPISEMEMDLLIESVVQEFNQGVKGEKKTEESPEAQAESEDVHESAGL
mgnify:FL=1